MSHCEMTYEIVWKTTSNYYPLFAYLHSSLGVGKGNNCIFGPYKNLQPGEMGTMPKKCQETRGSVEFNNTYY